MNKQITPRPMHNTSRLLEDLHKEATYCGQRGICYSILEDDELKGNEITINGKVVKNFGSCSYLGLELDDRLKEGAIEATRKYGPAFSSSRIFLSSPLYRELQELLEAIFDLPLVVAPTTTLGHIAAIPSLVDAADAIIMDHQVHASVQNAVRIAKTQGVHVEMIRHSSMENLEWRLSKLTKQFRNVWYCADGVYSMFGDTIPMQAMIEFLNTYENFYLYVDDAHGVSWHGEKGKGIVLSQLPRHEKMVVVGSMHKSFGSYGGILIFPDEELRNFVNNTGSTMFFSGPIPNPSLGAAVASAKIHLGPEHPILQQQLIERIRYTNDLAAQLGLPMIVYEETPIFFVAVSKPQVGYRVVQKMQDRGFFVNIASYPSVPLKNAGLRFTITNLHSFEDIQQMLLNLKKSLDEALDEERFSYEEIWHAFSKIAPPKKAAKAE
ncbi:MAG: aminotransferase class I/II-fold pyridoxal phosphate-dependent enzyme [Gammaproteobacteria bacterium]|nr:MAG: aminotransferase class I/II-fold pyridoxal phosphate-dependent enzyme [Gammaproteobacteria bacterium]